MPPREEILGGGGQAASSWLSVAGGRGDLLGRPLLSWPVLRRGEEGLARGFADGGEHHPAGLKKKKKKTKKKEKGDPPSSFPSEKATEKKKKKTVPRNSNAQKKGGGQRGTPLQTVGDRERWRGRTSLSSFSVTAPARVG